MERTIAVKDQERMAQKGRRERKMEKGKKDTEVGVITRELEETRAARLMTSAHVGGNNVLTSGTGGTTLALTGGLQTSAPSHGLPRMVPTGGQSAQQTTGTGTSTGGQTVETRTTGR